MMKETLLKSLCFVTGISIVVAAGACGQNTTVHRSTLDTITGESAHTAPVEHPGTDDDDSSTQDSGTATPPVSGDSDQPGSGGGNGGADQPGSGGGNGGADQPGSGGGNGGTDQPGSGSPTATVLIYRSGGYEKIIDAEPLDDEEFRELDLNTLPYIPTMSHPKGASYRHLVPVVNLGTRWGANDFIRINGVRHNLGQYTPYLQGMRPTIKDAQVIFKIPFRNLPPRNTLEPWDPSRNDRASLHMMVSKVSNEGSLAKAREFMTTEMICFLQIKWCSGDVYTAGNWKDNINPAFFNGRLPENSYFKTQALSEHERIGNKLYFYGDVVLPFDELLKRDSDNSQVMSVLDLIYGDTPEDQPLLSRDLYMVVADDTYVSRNLTHFRMRFRVKDGVNYVITPEAQSSGGSN